MQQQEGNNTDMWLFCVANVDFKLSEKNGTIVYQSIENVHGENTPKLQNINLSKVPQLGFDRKTEVSLGTPRAKRTRGLVELRKGWEHKSGSLPVQSMKPGCAVGAGRWPTAHRQGCPGACPKASIKLASAVRCPEKSVYSPLRTSGSCARGSQWQNPIPTPTGKRILESAAPRLSLWSRTGFVRGKSRGWIDGRQDNTLELMGY